MLLLARYVLPVSGPHIEDGGVVVHDGAIVAVGTREELIAAYPTDEIRDYGLAVLMPGFIDLHTHFEYASFRGVVNDLPYSRWKMQVMRLEELLTEQDWKNSAVLGAVESVRSGITTFADVTDSGTSVAPASQAGLRGVIYREVSTMDKSQVRNVVDAALADVAAWQDQVNPELLTIGIAPHSPYSCHPTLFKTVANEAGERGLPVALHLAGSKDEYDFIKYGSSSLGQDYRAQSGWSDVVWLPTGVSPVQYIYQWGILEVPNVLAVHCVHVDPLDVDTLARNDVAVAYCARCNLKLGMGIAPLQSFLEHGLRVGIGTDSPASNSTMDFFDEMRIGLLVQRGLAGEATFYRAKQFVRMATLEAARALRIDHLVGSLEPGKRADIIAVDLSRSHQVPTQDPYGAIVHTSNQEDVVMTMVDGRMLFEHGTFLTMDTAGLYDDVENARLKLKDGRA
jgi:5-methylthioadenosine/S-adenosylhomocysteine deaminase